MNDGVSTRHAQRLATDFETSDLNTPPSEPTSAAPAPGRQFNLRMILFLVFVAAYYLVFYGWSPAREVGLQIRLSWLLVPEVPLTEWVGGDWGRFGLADRVPILLCGAGMLTLSLAAGAVVLELLGLARGTTRLEYYLFAQAIGLNLLSTFLLAVGLAGGLLYGSVTLAAAGLVVAVAIWRRRALLPLWRSQAPPHPDRDQGPWFLRGRYGLVLAAPFATTVLLGSMLPPWHFDVREYHAQVPKEWYLQGSVDFMPHNVYGNMPLAAELPAVVGMQALRRDESWWWGTLVGKTLIGVYAILTTLAVYCFGRRFFSPATGVAAALVFLSTPWVGFVSMAGLIEGASALYTVLCFHALFLWAGADGERTKGPLVLAGWLAGAAIACKYPAILFVAFPAAMFLLGTFWAQRSGSWLALAVFLLGISVGSGLWLGKNAVLTGNPTYPLLYDLFGGKSRTPAKAAQWTNAHRTKQGDWSWPALQRSGLVLLVGSQFTSPLLVPFGLLGFVAYRRNWFVIVSVLLLLLVVSAWWLLTHRLERFLIPHLPFVAVLAGLGVTRWRHPLWNLAVGSVLAFSLLSNLTLISSRSVGDNRFWVKLDDLRQIGPEDLNEHNPHIHPAHLYLNHTLRPGHRALLCGEAQVFNLRVPVLYNTCFDDCVFEQLFRGRTRQQRIDELRRQRISHVMVYWHELDRYRSPGNYGYSSDYVTREVVRRELVAEQQILRPIHLDVETENSQLFEVVGWRQW